jgi:hypothetical protein
MSKEYVCNANYKCANCRKEIATCKDCNYKTDLDSFIYVGLNKQKWDCINCHSKKVPKYNKLNCIKYE